MCETRLFDIKAFCEAINHNFKDSLLIPKGFVAAEVYGDGSFNLKIGPRDITFDCTGTEIGAGTSRLNEWMIVPCIPHQRGRRLPPEVGGGPR